MARYGTRVQVYNSNIASMFLGGGEVNREATQITLLILTGAVARASAFSRSGHLAASHRRAVVPSGIYGTRGYVENTASYAKYKHEGTHGPIVSTRGFSSSTKGNYEAKMRLKPWGSYPAIFRREVKGQTGDPWLRNAANDVLLRYGVYVSQSEGFELL